MRRAYAKLTGHRPVRGRALREQAADHGHGDGERAERARARARSHRRGQPQVARLHARQPARRHRPKSWRASRSTAPTSTSEAGRRRIARWSSGRSRAPAGAIRRWNRRSSTSSARSCCRATPEGGQAAGSTIAAPAIRRPTRTKRGSGCSFAMKLQQYTGPVQAKGLEDTAFYRYNLLLSLNEVGGDPSGSAAPSRSSTKPMRRARHWPLRDAGDRDARHQARRRLARAHQRALGDARRMGARSLALDAAEPPHRTIVDGEPAPDRNDEYRFYQALVGTWPRSSRRPAAGIGAGAISSSGCSGLHAQGGQGSEGAHELADAEQPYEEGRGAVRRARALTGSGRREGSCRLRAVPARRVARVGVMNSLAQVVLKIGSPGCPTSTRGPSSGISASSIPTTAGRSTSSRALLDEVDACDKLPDERAAAIEPGRNWRDGRVKLLVTAAASACAARCPTSSGRRYLPLTTESPCPPSSSPSRASATVAPCSLIVAAPGRNSGVEDRAAVAAWRRAPGRRRA